MNVSPFLPEPEVTAPSPKKKSGTKVLLLWVVLIVMFLTIWQFLTPAERPSTGTMPDMHGNAVQHSAEACTSSSPFWATLLPLSPLVVVVILVFLFLRAYRQNDTFNLAQEPGRLAMVSHRFDEAVDLFRAAVPPFARQPAYRCMAMLNVADALLRAGRLDEAIVAYAEVERAQVLVLGSSVRTRLATQTALVYALDGNVAVAERWIADGRARIAKNKDDRLSHAAHLCVAEAVLASRKGDHAGAISILDARWLELRYALNADFFRAVEIIRTFAETQRGVRGSNAAAERLIRVEPVSKGEFAFLGAKWPEMKLFLDAHGVSASAAGVAPSA